MSVPRGATVGYYAAVALLLVGLAVGGVLVARLIGGTTELDVRVGAPVAVTCEAGVGAPACFRIAIGNEAGQTVSAQCLTVPAEGTQARIVGGEATAVLTLLPGEERTLTVAVDPLDGGVVGPPSMRCAPVAP
ncbi:MAG: hypothetical protein KatS3mg013_0806 [Actinomycetota bacterium]|jgi:hypothetical protein|nr:MAG: hypothetical protein KatS3mg013_0806 [Actinomycetota bacterium]